MTKNKGATQLIKNTWAGIASTYIGYGVGGGFLMLLVHEPPPLWQWATMFVLAVAMIYLGSISHLKYRYAIKQVGSGGVEILPE